MRKTSFLSGALVIVAALAPLSAQAIVLLPPCATTSVPEKAGNCGITDLLSVFINFGELLLAVTGSVALVFFVWGGFQMILSAGNKDKIQKGKDTIVRATIGIFIIFFSGLIVRFTGEALTGAKGSKCMVLDDKLKTYTVNGQKDGEPCVPKVGDTCSDKTIKTPVLDDAGKPVLGKNKQPLETSHPGAIWISLPAGYTQENDPAGSFVQEGLYCMPKTSEKGTKGCALLNAVMKDRHRSLEEQSYTCMSTSDPKASRCVRGICGGGADFACCIPKP